jgi:hypothetical protein
MARSWDATGRPGVGAVTRRSPSKGSNDTTQLGRPADTMVDPDTNELFVADGFGRSVRNAGQFHWVHHPAIDSRGDVFTTEVDNGKRVHKFHPAR